jgi:acetyl-CoA carboxylase biotin carboxyl carrier protein
VELTEIRKILEMMEKFGISYFQLERDQQKIELRRGPDYEELGKIIAQSAPPPHFSYPSQHAFQAPPPPAPAITTAEVPAADAIGPTVNSPMVGTFYRSAGPGEDVFVKVGDTITEDTVVCIIEAMKVMNEIKAEAKGTIKRILVDDASPVQYGEPLFELEA